MARISTTVAALTLALTAGAGMAHAQGMSSTPTPYSTGGSTIQPMQQAPMTTQAPPMAAPMPLNGRQMPQQPYGTSSSPRPMVQPIVGPRAQVPTPAQPFANLNLPNEPQIGDGAYNGGGVVIEHMADGTTRIVR